MVTTCKCGGKTIKVPATKKVAAKRPLVKKVAAKKQSAASRRATRIATRAAKKNAAPCNCSGS